MKYLKNAMHVLVLAVFLTVSLPTSVHANERGTETGDDVAVILDLVVLRPVGFIATVGGMVAFVVSLPISIPTLSVGKAFNALVVNPAHYTFVRELGEEK